MKNQVTCRVRASGISIGSHWYRFPPAGKRQCSAEGGQREGWSWSAGGNNDAGSLCRSVFCVPELQLLNFQTQTSMYSVSLAEPTQQGGAKLDSILLRTSAALLPAELQGKHWAGNDAGRRGGTDGLAGAVSGGHTWL